MHQKAAHAAQGVHGALYAVIQQRKGHHILPVLHGMLSDTYTRLLQKHIRLWYDCLVKIYRSRIGMLYDPSQHICARPGSVIRYFYYFLTILQPPPAASQLISWVFAGGR